MNPRIEGRSPSIAYGVESGAVWQRISKFDFPVAATVFGAQHRSRRNPGGSLPSRSGLVLMDPSLTPIALDHGAAAIFAGCRIPKEILDVIRSRKPADLSSLEIHFRTGTREYVCRAFLVESPNGDWTRPLLALHLEAVSDPIHEVAAVYNLTERERETLRCISMGLTIKESAGRMDISPNTVKVFVRLIMIKMGVTTRGGIVAELLQNCQQGRSTLTGIRPLREQAEQNSQFSTESNDVREFSNAMALFSSGLFDEAMAIFAQLEASSDRALAHVALTRRLMCERRLDSGSDQGLTQESSPS